MSSTLICPILRKTMFTGLDVLPVPVRKEKPYPLCALMNTSFWKELSGLSRSNCQGKWLQDSNWILMPERSLLRMDREGAAFRVGQSLRIVPLKDRGLRGKNDQEEAHREEQVLQMGKPGPAEPISGLSGSFPVLLFFLVHSQFPMALKRICQKSVL